MSFDSSTLFDIFCQRSPSVSVNRIEKTNRVKPSICSTGYGGYFLSFHRLSFSSSVVYFFWSNDIVAMDTSFRSSRLLHASDSIISSSVDKHSVHRIRNAIAIRNIQHRTSSPTSLAHTVHQPYTWVLPVQRWSLAVYAPLNGEAQCESYIKTRTMISTLCSSPIRRNVSICKIPSIDGKASPITVI